MRIPRTALAGVIAAASFALVAPVIAGGKGEAVGQKYPTSQNTVHDCGDDRTITFAGPATLWPPNHKYFEAVITATGDGDDQVTIESAGTHDEYTASESGEQTEMQGAGNTADDVNPAADADGGHGNVASVTQSIRSERSGQGDGREYTFSVIATFDDETCTAEFTSNVPHDMRPANRT